MACPAGGVSVVLGTNFGGKTALCRLVAGLHGPATGRVTLDGEPLDDLSPGDRPVALVVQDFVNYPHWTVAQNIASPMRAAGRSAESCGERVAELAATLGLSDHLNKLPDALSGGQQQRLAIARALGKEASVLVMDEPFVNLDYRLRDGLRDELRALAEQAGLHVLYTTTDPNEALSLADTLTLFSDHTVLQHGAPMALYEKPVSFAAADLMSDPGVNRLPTGGDDAVVRPEHVLLERSSERDLCFEFVVEEAETNGSVTFVHGTVESEPWLVRVPRLFKPEVDSRHEVFVRQSEVLRWTA